MAALVSGIVAADLNRLARFKKAQENVKSGTGATKLCCLQADVILTSHSAKSARYVRRGGAGHEALEMPRSHRISS
jgi:hypothetical protein